MSFFSIIIPTYNRSSRISTAISSVINQTYQDWELIIIDDGSTDNTKEIIESFTDNRIKYFHQKNQERSIARNNGISKANGVWICFLDSDDAFLTNHLSVFYESIIKNNEPRLIINKIKIINEITNNTRVHNSLDLNSPNILVEIAKKFILMNTVCIHHSLLVKNRFHPAYSIWEDTHLWLRIASIYKVEQNEIITSLQIVHPENSVSLVNKNISISKVNSYVKAIDDLFNKKNGRLVNNVDHNFGETYKLNKLHMFLYQSRQNKQFLISLKIWSKIVIHKFTPYLILDFFKIIGNKMNLGIHEK